MSNEEIIIVRETPPGVERQVEEIIIERGAGSGPTGPGLPSGTDPDDVNKLVRFIGPGSFAYELFTLTKSFIGLGNVTDNAQLKRSAGDFQAFTQKITPGAGDSVLVEDGSDGENKKRVDIAAFLGGGLKNVTTKTGAGTLSVAEAGEIKVSAATPYTLNLPTAIGNTGLEYFFTKTDANYKLIQLDAFGAQTFLFPNADSTAELTYNRLNTFGAKVSIISDGANWIITGEDLGQVPECFVWLSANQNNITTNTFVVVNLDRAQYNIGNNFNLTTHEFTVPIPGRYFIISKIDWFAPVADKLYYNFVFNGFPEIIGAKFHSSNTSSLGTETVLNVDLIAGDVLTQEARQDSGVNTPDIEGGVSNKTLFNIKLISKVK